MRDIRCISYSPSRESWEIVDGKVQKNIHATYHVPKDRALYYEYDAYFYYEIMADGNARQITEAEYQQALRTNEMEQKVNDYYFPEVVETPSATAVEVLPRFTNPYLQQQPTYTFPVMATNVFNTYNANLTANMGIAKVVTCNSEPENEVKPDAPESYGDFTITPLVRRHYIFRTSTEYKDSVYILFRIIYPAGYVDKEVLGTNATDPKWISTATNHLTYVKHGKKAADAFAKDILHLMSDSTIPEEYIHGYSGWEEFSNGHHGFLYADGVIGFDAQNIHADKTFKICYDATQVGKQDTFLATLKMLDITQNRTIMPVLYLFTHTSVMTSLFAQAHYPVKFILAIMGQSNSKKTSLALATLRLFNTDTNAPDTSFISTSGGIEVMMSKYADATLIIDDYMPSTNKGRQIQTDNKFDEITRRYGDHSEKKRMTDFMPNGNKVDYPARGCCAITGEQMHGVQSALARTVTVNLSKTDVISENLKFFQDNYTLLPTHLFDFISFVAANYNNIVNLIHDKVPFYRQSINVKIARLAEAFAVLAVTKDILSLYIRERRFMKETAIIRLGEYLIDSITTIIFSNDLEFITQDPGVLCLMALSDAIVNKTIPILHRSNYRERSEVILEDDNRYYTRTDTIFLITKQYCAKLDIPIALVNPKAVIPALEHIGVLDFTKERSRKLPDSSIDSRRYLYIIKDNMAKVLEQTEQEVNYDV